MYSKFGHHPQPLSYLCAEFCFFRSPTAEPARGKNHVLSHSLNHPAYLMHREVKLLLWNNKS